MALRCLTTIILLLSFPRAMFGDSPSTIREFVEGHRTTFSTKGHPKANGVNFTIAYPNGWKSAEGERPNIVQKFVSEGGRGLETMMIIAIELPVPAGTTIAGQELVELVAPSALREMLPRGATFVSAKSTAIEADPAGILEFTMRADRAGMSLFMHAWTLNFIQGNTLVQVQFQVGGLAGAESEVERRMAAYKPLFTLMANTIVFPDKWSAPSQAEAPSAKSDAKSSLTFDDPGTLVLTLLASFLITWGLGLTPSIVVRYAVVRRPLSRKSASWIAAGSSAIFWIGLSLLHHALGEEPGRGVVWIVIFFVARWIMSRGYTSPSPGVPKAVSRERHIESPERTGFTETTSHEDRCAAETSTGNPIEQDDNVGFSYAELSQPPKIDIRPDPPSAPRIGGWLWYAAFLVTLAPLSWLGFGGQLRLIALQRRQAGFEGDSVADMIDPLGIFVGCAGAAFSVYVAIMFWRKSRKAPALVISQITAGFCASIMVYGACSIAFPIRWDEFELVRFGIQVLIGGLWIWYFLRSKRVARTFVNR